MGQSIEKLIERSKTFKHVNNDSTVYLLEKVLILTESLDNDSLHLAILSQLIDAQIRSGDYVSALKDCDVFNQIAAFNNHKEKIKGKILTANVFLVSGLVSEALLKLNEADMLNKQESYYNVTNEIEINYLLGMTNYMLNEYKLCNSYLNKAIHTGANKSLSIVIGSLILKSNTFSNPDSIMINLTKALEISKKGVQTSYENTVILNDLALLHEYLGDLSKSRSFYLQAIHIAKKHRYKSYLSELYNNFAYQLMAEHNYDSIPIILDEALTITRDLNNIDIEASLLDTYSDYYTEIENFQSALEFKKLSIKKRNEYREKQQINKSLFLATVFETEKKELEILKQEGRANRFRAIFFGTLSALIMVLAITFYYRQKSATRKVKLLASQQEKEIGTANALIEGQDSERKRLAMDLHDGLGARIGVLRFNLDKALAKNPKHDDIVSDLINIGNHIRELSHRLLPTKMEEYGLVFSLQSLIESINQSNQVSISIQQNLKNRLPEKLENQVYHMVFEMLNNAMKHSGCQNIFIQLMQHNAILYLSVEDDGKGFTPDITADGLGLKNIRQRVAYLAGNIEISTELKKGTILMIEIPVESND